MLPVGTSALSSRRCSLSTALTWPIQRHWSHSYTHLHLWAFLSSAISLSRKDRLPSSGAWPDSAWLLPSCSDSLQALHPKLSSLSLTINFPHALGRMAPLFCLPLHPSSLVYHDYLASVIFIYNPFFSCDLTQQLHKHILRFVLPSHDNI